MEIELPDIRASLWGGSWSHKGYSATTRDIIQGKRRGKEIHLLLHSFTFQPLTSVCHQPKPNVRHGQQ